VKLEEKQTDCSNPTDFLDKATHRDLMEIAAEE